MYHWLKACQNLSYSKQIYVLLIIIIIYYLFNILISENDSMSANQII